MAALTQEKKNLQPCQVIFSSNQHENMIVLSYLTISVQTLKGRLVLLWGDQSQSQIEVMFCGWSKQTKWAEYATVGLSGRTTRIFAGFKGEIARRLGTEVASVTFWNGWTAKDFLFLSFCHTLSAVSTLKVAR